MAGTIHKHDIRHPENPGYKAMHDKAAKEAEQLKVAAPKVEKETKKEGK